MGSIWSFFSDEENKRTLGWLGGGAVVAAGGLWAALTYVWPAPTASAPTAVTIGSDTVVKGPIAGRDNNFHGPVTFGLDEQSVEAANERRHREEMAEAAKTQALFKQEHPDIVGIKKGWNFGDVCKDRAVSLEKLYSCYMSKPNDIDDEYVLVGFWFRGWLDMATMHDDATMHDYYASKKSAKHTHTAEEIKREQVNTAEEMEQVKMISYEYTKMADLNNKLFLNVNTLCSAVGIDDCQRFVRFERDWRLITMPVAK